MQQVTKDTGRLDYQPKKFVVWLFVVASVILFASLTSAYIVMRSQGRWLHFLLPGIFNISTFILISSSISLQGAYIAARRLKFGQEKLLLWLTFFLGICFLISQWLAWRVLVHNGVFFSGNPSGSFLYVISGFHAIHIIAGLFMLIYAISGAHRTILQAKNIYRIQIALIFWHFLDFLWIYLYVFLLLNQ